MHGQNHIKLKDIEYIFVDTSCAGFYEDWAKNRVNMARFH